MVCVVGVAVGCIAVGVGSTVTGVAVGWIAVGLGSTTVVGVAVGATIVDVGNVTGVFVGWIVIGVGLATDWGVAVGSVLVDASATVTTSSGGKLPSREDKLKLSVLSVARMKL